MNKRGLFGMILLSIVLVLLIVLVILLLAAIGEWGEWSNEPLCVSACDDLNLKFYSYSEGSPYENDECWCQKSNGDPILVPRDGRNNDGK